MSALNGSMDVSADLPRGHEACVELPRCLFVVRNIDHLKETLTLKFTCMIGEESAKNEKKVAAYQIGASTAEVEMTNPLGKHVVPKRRYDRSRDICPAGARITHCKDTGL